MRNLRKIYECISAVIITFVIAFTSFSVGTLNSKTFAAAVCEVPILSALAQVITGEEITQINDVVNIYMKIPKVEGLGDLELEERINAEIREKMIAKVERAKKEAIEEKRIWLSTGGDGADYVPRYISVNYEVKANTKDVLSFVVEEMEIRANAVYDLHYYNIDLTTNKELTLEDLLGEDYIAIANKQIRERIAFNESQGQVYFDGSDGIEGFKSISVNQNFFINERGNPVVVFNKYEIAPGYMGIQEFEIIK